MLNLENMSAGLNKGKIKDWIVVFHVVPMGIVRTIDEAMEACKKYDLNQIIAIVPVPAVVTETGEIEVIFR
jgi:hypothetical protein